MVAETPEKGEGQSYQVVAVKRSDVTREEFGGVQRDISVVRIENNLERSDLLPLTVVDRAVVGHDQVNEVGRLVLAQEREEIE
ncbi:hypothetical protein A2U01_0074502, partial [Trifolium medium]|nr:hypothetical protein [Trifolium medium]